MNEQDPLQSLLQSLPPDALAQILRSGTLDQQDALLQQQIAQAHALRAQKAGHPAYGAGAGIGAGIDDILGNVKEGILQNRQQDSLKQRQTSLDALVAALRGRAPAQPMAATNAYPSELSLMGGGE